MFSGIANSMSTMHRLSEAKSRSISAENPTGEPGQGGRAETGVSASCARELGVGWKINPYVLIEPGQESVLADIHGAGAIEHIWMTIGPAAWREMILRMYWDDAPVPAVEVPAGDFFANGWNEYAPVNSLPICVNPARAFNCYWTMPFFKRARITMENRSDQTIPLYYQVDYVLDQPEEDSAYFCATFRRSNPTKNSIHTLLAVPGKGHYVGTYLAWQVNNNGWWGEGEMKFYMDGDREFPTICTTGTEDYFGGAYNFDVPGQGYATFSGPYTGMPQRLAPDGLYRANTRFGLYRFHLTDPVRFENGIRVEIQDLGWRRPGLYLAQQSDIASVAFFYQAGNTFVQPPLYSRDYMEII